MRKTTRKTMSSESGKMCQRLMTVENLNTELERDAAIPLTALPCAAAFSTKKLTSKTSSF